MSFQISFAVLFKYSDLCRKFASTTEQLTSPTSIHFFCRKNWRYQQVHILYVIAILVFVYLSWHWQWL